MRRRVGLLFGGRSAEHDVSRMSAANVLRALDPERFEVVPIGIGRDGRWRLGGGAGNGGGIGGQALVIPDGAPAVALVPGGGGELLVLDETGSRTERLDAVVPVLHGPNGEDGTVQGLLELAGVPYVGSGVMGSAAAMDKDVAKRLLRDAGVPVVPFAVLSARRMLSYEQAAAAVEADELFVKPANMGSSVGVSRARNAVEFARACSEAFRHDEKVLAERSVAGAREIECSVLEEADGTVRASPLGEIVPAEHRGFYSYEAKYVDPDGAALVVPAELEAGLAQRIRAMAVDAFAALECGGLARVDFFVEPGAGGAVFVNEINTLPGFTAISMYPKLWEAAGMSQGALMATLVAQAMARFERRRSLAAG
ncbi:MAG: D-alanine--D-alanine ligase [Gluconacetobacter diazotrophicus]|nr:D-alanine--D-alanine ligase [Gluconacetobacter diazotrophicus]